MHKIYYLSFDKALELSRERNEVFEFDTKEEAEAFAQGSWKDVSTAEAEIESYYNRKGLNYETERKLLFDYEEAKSDEAFLDWAPFRLTSLSAEDQALYGDKFYINGKLRGDSKDLYYEAGRIKMTLQDKYCLLYTSDAADE